MDMLRFRIYLLSRSHSCSRLPGLNARQTIVTVASTYIASDLTFSEFVFKSQCYILTATTVIAKLVFSFKTFTMAINYTSRWWYSIPTGPKFRTVGHTSQTNMPHLLFCNRFWRISSDDFSLPALCSIVYRFAQ